MNSWLNLKSKKTLAAIAAAVGIVAFSVCTFAAVQMCWLTPGERDAARAALAAVDDLRTFAALDDGADPKLKQAEDAVETARQAARTRRDQDVAFALIQYLGSIEDEQATMSNEGPAQEPVAVPPVHGVQPGDAAHFTETAISRSLSLKLHETLD